MLLRDSLLSILILAGLATARHDIRDYGARPGEDSHRAEIANAQAFLDAIDAANSAVTALEEREVYVPGNLTFHMMPVAQRELHNLTITIDGTILASKRHHFWPHDGGKVAHLFYFAEAHNFTMRGNGTVDGQGYMWWIREYLGTNHHGRPCLIRMDGATNIEFTGIRWMNSPYYHLDIQDFDGGWFHDFEIYVDSYGQLELDRLFMGSSKNGSQSGKNGLLPSPRLPTYALNTDGLDPRGKNFIVERLNITNYDDAVAIKNMKVDGTYAQCSENIIVRDCNVWFGVGMTIGSIIPSDRYSCVRNVTFSNHTFYHPFKAVYVKNNPGVTTTMEPGSGGEATGIHYENLVIHNPIWWAIYIGPQQQNQPHGGGPGCLLYPLIPCETNPLVTFADISLRNVTVYDAILPPGIVRCHKTNPCTGFTFDNVQASGWWSKLGLNYITENVYGEVSDSKPAPRFITSDGDGFVENNNLEQFIAMIWSELTGLFSPGYDEEEEAATLTKAKSAGKRAANMGYFLAVEQFRNVYEAFTN